MMAKILLGAHVRARVTGHVFFFGAQLKGETFFCFVYMA